MSKSIFASKTFWVNLLTGVATVAEVLPPHYAALALAIANIGLRYVTSEAVHILPK